MIIDGEPFALTAKGGKAHLVCLSTMSAKPDIILETTYEALLSLGEGEMDLGEFTQQHCHIDIKTPGIRNAEFTKLISAH